ncbi:geranylgeranyl diphosphate synthase, type II [Lactonifactor longoviformis DSM 17459]|uniref:Farnesyl diphosphate synthase n=1 Tax=Lactonifactor longoviformis DSM 17459 TaxID=1122155 RepID=A0A1M4VIU8_9CLOT|nr:geranylgeranyl diphosphate synthase, type II [Lactonifactor longoviformis DSM 17459]
MENSVNFKEELQKKTERAERIIRRYLPAEEGFSQRMAEAVNYSMTAPGKRLRPIMMEEAYLLFLGRDRMAIEPFMAALEMIHTHSLIHDDLPALDNDDYRRGKKTTHVVYGEAAAILAGDALLNYAYETAFLAFQSNTDPAVIGQALEILGRKTGIHGMLGGQGVDVENDGIPINREMLNYIYRNKTSALIEAALMTGAVLAGAEKYELEAMERIGRNIGLAFQIQDDILDVTGDEKELGKPVHSDEKNHKTTWVTLQGLKDAHKEAEKLTQEAVCELSSLTGDGEFLISLISSLSGRKK